MNKGLHVNIENDAVHEAAADWFARLQERQVSLEDTAQWQQWMAASAAHAVAFRRIEETWNRFEGMPKPALMATRELQKDRYDGTASVSEFKKGSSTLAPFALAASVALVAIGVMSLLFVSRDLGISGGATQTLQTDVGENRSVRLEDGSQVTLGGHTQLEVAFGAQSRRLQLIRGEAFFAVAKDPARPFSVRAGTATVTAVGTEFNVRRGENRVVVAVMEGRVLVEPSIPALQQLPVLRDLTPRAPRRVPRQLEAGNQTVIDESGIESSVELPDPKVAASWQSGRLAFEHEPLRYVLEDVNRYARKPIVLGDEAIGELKITGTVINDNVEGWIASLEAAFALRATENPERIVLTRAK